MRVLACFVRLCMLASARNGSLLGQIKAFWPRQDFHWLKAALKVFFSILLVYRGCRQQAAIAQPARHSAYCFDRSGMSSTR
mmetsp:Transcript_85142/g.268542  ORF Transcript_85142/g.268542 Transcript_85142/m.268542 type:complete len:81 (-) Transcript_85142:62-304(-)